MRLPIAARAAMLALLLAAAACTKSPCSTPAEDNLTLLTPLSLGRPLVPVTVNGQSIPLLIDTGAAVTVLYPETVRALGLRPDPLRTRDVTGFGGAATAQEVSVEQLRIGSRNFDGLSLLALGERPGKGRGGGFLGADLLRQTALELNLPGDRIALHDAAACSAPPASWGRDFERIPIVVAPNGLVLLPVQIGDEVLITLLDTGATHTSIDVAAARRAGMPNSVLSATPSGRSLGVGPNRLPFHLWSVSEMRIGTERMRNVPVAVHGMPASSPVDMVLGADYLARRRLWLSYATQTLYVQTIVPEQGNFDLASSREGERMRRLPGERGRAAGARQLAAADWSLDQHLTTLAERQPQPHMIALEDRLLQRRR